MSNITREYALELASLYGIEINENSNKHLVEDLNGIVRTMNESDISDLFGIDFGNDAKWHSVKNNDFNSYDINEHFVDIKFNFGSYSKEFTPEELKGVA